MSAKSSVIVVGGNVGIKSMFSSHGFDVLELGSPEPDLICFTGGEDVTPFLYGEGILHLDGAKMTSCSPSRDMLEIKVFHKYFDTPKVGICRGGQLLNVLSGGTMFQHVNNHTNNHPMQYVSGWKQLKDKSREPIWSTMECTSTHHQMMRAGYHADIIGVAGMSTKKYTDEKTLDIVDPEKHMLDNEIIHYWHTQSLCFQPHPEYVPEGHALRKLFFNYIELYLNVSAKKKGS